jgi:AraC-like DNA-binding protein
MLLQDFLPSPEVREFIQCYRIVHFTFDNLATIPAKAYPPKAENILHFFLRGHWAVGKPDGNIETKSPVTFIGQQTFVAKQYNTHDFLNFHIVFQPTALFRLTSVPAFEVTNQLLDAEYLFSTNIRFTLEQLQQAKSYAELIGIGETFVRNLIRNTRREFQSLDSVAQHLIKSHGNLSLDYLANQTCLSTKQFKRKFNERTGINPKTFTRIIRFNKAFNIKNGFPERDWLQIAVDCGYYDYQHLAKDYKDFTGLTPVEFHLLESKSPENVLGLASEIYRSRISML